MGQRNQTDDNMDLLAKAMRQAFSETNPQADANEKLERPPADRETKIGQPKKN